MGRASRASPASYVLSPHVRVECKQKPTKFSSSVVLAMAEATGHMLVSRTFFRHDYFCVKSYDLLLMYTKSRILSLQEENPLLLLWIRKLSHSVIFLAVHVPYQQL